MGLIRIHKHIAIPVVGTCRFHAYLLVPAVHAAYRVRVDRERHVLMHAGILPPDAVRIRIVALERLHALKLTHKPLSLADILQVHKSRRPALAAVFLGESPASEMMRTRHYSGADTFSDPHSNDEVPHFSIHLGKVPGLKVKTLGVLRMHP